MRLWFLTVLVTSTIMLIACQPAAPTATPPVPAATSAAQAGPTGAPALGIDLRLPPTRAPRPSPTAQGRDSASPAVVPSPSPGPSVTLSDQDRTVALQVGHRVLVNLGEEFDWTVEIDDPSILSRVPNIAVVRGAQGVYEAHRAGQAVLTASGDPVCRKVQPACAQASRPFRVQIAVQ